MKTRRKKSKNIVAIRPIVEFFDLEPEDSSRGKRVELFSSAIAKDHPYLKGLKETLKRANGIYIFYDSRGRALYAGKARDRFLWSELKSAFNRDRHDHQKIKRVEHPYRRVSFLSASEKLRRIRPVQVPLHELASYVSIYEVIPGFIDDLEALIVRAFANDLVNARMEKFPQLRKSKKEKSGAKKEKNRQSKSRILLFAADNRAIARSYR
jgi:hypothetical protein